MTIIATVVTLGGSIAHTPGDTDPLLSLSDSAEKHATYFDASTFALRKSADFSVKRPKVSLTAPDGYTQARNTVLLRYPIELANGLVTVNTVSIQSSISVETPLGDISNLRMLAADLLFEGALNEYWTNQSLV